MQGAELVLALLIAVATLVTIARRLGMAYPILLATIGSLAIRCSIGSATRTGTGPSTSIGNAIPRRPMETIA